MKKMKKLTSMLLALTMSLILAVPCFAAESDVTTEVYDLGNGVIATITIQPADRVPKPFSPEVDVNGTASPSKTLTYSLFPSDGTHCNAHVMNMEAQSSGTNMSVHFEVRFHNGQQWQSQSNTVTPRMTATINITDTTGNGLDCDIVTNISAINSESVAYNYWHFQG